MSVKLFGRIPDPAFRAKFVNSLLIQHVPSRLVQQIQRDKRDVYLWQAKDKAEPNWRREAQGIGDCVSWGAALVCDCLMWLAHVKGEMEFEAEAASEAIYGGCRVEIAKGVMRNGDGASGSWAADWLNKYGILLRKDYRQETGVDSHDLTTYSARKAKEWGYYGNGGGNDEGKLDEVARKYPVKDVTQVRTIDEAIAALAAGCPITIASSAGFNPPRDQEGVIDINDQWPHQMCILGMRALSSGQMLFRVFNSWADSCSGPDPGIDDDAVSACSWWITEQSLTRILQEEDSFAFSGVSGFVQAAYDFGTNLFV